MSFDEAFLDQLVAALKAVKLEAIIVGNAPGTKAMPQCTRGAVVSQAAVPPPRRWSDGRSPGKSSASIWTLPIAKAASKSLP